MAECDNLHEETFLNDTNDEEFGAESFLDETEEVLLKLDKKYSPEKFQVKSKFEESLIILSKEFDTLDIPKLNLNQNNDEILQQVVENSRSLIQMYRSSICEIREVKLNNQGTKFKEEELYKKIIQEKERHAYTDTQRSVLKIKVDKLLREQRDYLIKEKKLNNELKTMKVHYNSKLNEIRHHLRRLNAENDKLKELCGQDINIHKSKDEIVVKLIQKYKKDEESYKKIICQLEQNNKDLIEEIFNLRESLAKINTN